MTEYAKWIWLDHKIYPNLRIDLARTSEDSKKTFR